MNPKSALGERLSLNDEEVIAINRNRIERSREMTQFQPNLNDPLGNRQRRPASALDDDRVARNSYNLERPFAPLPTPLQPVPQSIPPPAPENWDDLVEDAYYQVETWDEQEEEEELNQGDDVLDEDASWRPVSDVQLAAQQADPSDQIYSDSDVDEHDYARPSRGGKTRPMHFDTDNSSSDDDGPSNKRPRIEPKTQVDPRDAASSSSDRQNGQHQPNQQRGTKRSACGDDEGAQERPNKVARGASCDREEDSDSDSARLVIDFLSNDDSSSSPSVHSEQECIICPKVLPSWSYPLRTSTSDIDDGTIPVPGPSFYTEVSTLRSEEASTPSVSQEPEDDESDSEKEQTQNKSDSQRKEEMRKRKCNK